MLVLSCGDAFNFSCTSTTAESRANLAVMPLTFLVLQQQQNLGRTWCLVMVEWPFLVVPLGCLQFVIVVSPDHTHLLFLYGASKMRLSLPMA